jgi:hypothetical protein
MRAKRRGHSPRLIHEKASFGPPRKEWRTGRDVPSAETRQQGTLSVPRRMDPRSPTYVRLFPVCRHGHERRRGAVARARVGGSSVRARVPRSHVSLKGGFYPSTQRCRPRETHGIICCSRLRGLFCWRTKDLPASCIRDRNPGRLLPRVGICAA